MTTSTDTSIDEAIQHATRAWQLFDGPASWGALIGDWAHSTNADGHPVATARIHGAQAYNALRRFAANYNLILGRPGDQHPKLAFTETGIEVSWRYHGVWIRLLAA